MYGIEGRPSVNTESPKFSSQVRKPASPELTNTPTKREFRRCRRLLIEIGTETVDWIERARVLRSIVAFAILLVSLE